MEQPSRCQNLTGRYYFCPARGTSISKIVSTKDQRMYSSVSLPPGSLPAVDRCGRLRISIWFHKWLRYAQGYKLYMQIPVNMYIYIVQSGWRIWLILYEDTLKLIHHSISCTEGLGYLIPHEDKWWWANVRVGDNSFFCPMSKNNGLLLVPYIRNLNLSTWNPFSRIPRKPLISSYIQRAYCYRWHHSVFWNVDWHWDPLGVHGTNRSWVSQVETLFLFVWWSWLALFANCRELELWHKGYDMKGAMQGYFLKSEVLSHPILQLLFRMSILLSIHPSIYPI
jgi:hypothetical protein